MSFSYTEIDPVRQRQLQRRSAAGPFALAEGDELSLHFDAGAVQSRMRTSAPDELVLDYTQMLMGFLLFNPEPKCMAMIGLGGGSLAKYCLRHIKLDHFVAVEIDGDVIAMRAQFAIPPDSKRFRVVHANGAEFVQTRQPPLDVLIVDGFTANGISPMLCTAGFYDNCFARLAANGVLALNFLSSDPKFGSYAARVRESFEDKVISIETPMQGNHILFAFKGNDFPPPQQILKVREEQLAAQHPTDFCQIASKVIGRAKQRVTRKLEF